MTAEFFLFNATYFVETKSGLAVLKTGVPASILNPFKPGRYYNGFKLSYDMSYIQKTNEEVLFQNELYGIAFGKNHTRVIYL